MANYCCATRSNYFRVKDPEGFLEFMKHVVGEDAVEVWQKEAGGKTFYGFGCYGTIEGYERPEDNNNEAEISFCDFLDGLREFVAEDDAVIILEAGNEKLRYMIGCAIIVTSEDVRTIDLTCMAMEEAASMLDNPNWRTVCDY